jgi:hypothetical protein
MLYQYLRVINSDNGVLKDLSLRNQEEGQTIPMALVVNEDYIYLGQHYPFNNFFIQTNVANDVTADLGIQYWDSKTWRDAVDILDGTADNNGKPLTKSGIVQFSPDPQYGWFITSDTKRGSYPAELETLNIFNVYWLRLKYSATLKNTTAIKRFTFAFSRHQQIDSYDAKINQYLDSFAPGKTNWDDEIVTATLMLIRDLKRRGLAQNQGSVLRLDDFSIPTDWKTLELIYRSLGGDYKEKLAEAKEQYNFTLSLERYSIDRDEDAFLSRGEINNSVRSMVR